MTRNKIKKAYIKHVQLIFVKLINCSWIFLPVISQKCKICITQKNRNIKKKKKEFDDERRKRKKKKKRKRKAASNSKVFSPPNNDHKAHHQDLASSPSRFEN